MASSLRGTLETILVVDDTDVVLRVVATILEDAGFVVLRADTGAEAVKLALDYTGVIDLLLSDVQMPAMSGPQLGDIILKTRPHIHVMFMSGYSDGDLLVLNYGWAFIRKPFVAGRLVEMIESVLRSPNRSQGTDRFDSRG